MTNNLLDLLLLVFGLGMALTYMYFVGVVRANSDKLNVDIDNYFVINFPKVYKYYLQYRRETYSSIGFLFYFHCVSIVMTTILSCYLEGRQPFSG